MAHNFNEFMKLLDRVRIILVLPVCDRGKTINLNIYL
jgi:hypothetical protein